MTSKAKSTPLCSSALPGRIAGITAASAMTGLMLASVGLLFSAPRAAAEAPLAGPADPVRSSDPSIERGRYLVQIGGCNDCHTAGYGESAGRTPMSEWLTGWPDVGFKGPWGTSYAANLRLTVNGLSEEQWLPFARAQRLPPMPWFNLRDMNDDDLRAIYRFIRDLGPKGERAPVAVAPGKAATTPVIIFEPRNETSGSIASAAR